MSIRFSKMHGLGNDFMVIDAVTQKVELTAGQIAALADRHTGIGFDQLLMVAPPSNADADFWYRIYNQDGSEAEQCGNGARCISVFVRREQLASREELIWQTNTGTIRTRCLKDGVEVDMGPPSTESSTVPYSVGEQDSGYGFEVDVEGTTYRVHPVSMGNPHGVLFVDNVQNAPVEQVGKALTRHERFPEGANIGFCQVIDRNFVRLRVWERGVGETRACGSGACAAAVAGQLTGSLDERVKVSLPGGKLRIRWPGTDAAVKMAGPAAHVFDGVLDPKSLQKSLRANS